MSTDPAFAMRSLLFAPGNRADVLTKMPRSTPSAAVIDLEDAVPPDRKSEARDVDAAYREAIGRGEAAISVRGEMVDEPVARRARALLATDG